MKTTLLAIVTLVAFVFPAFGGGGEWQFVDSTNTSIVGDWNRPRALQSVNNALPAKIPGLGSRRAVREYCVGRNDMAMNVNVGLQVEDPYVANLMTGRWSDGYDSYEEFLDDIRVGLQFVLQAVKTNAIGQINPNVNTYVIVHVTYFHDGKTEDRGNTVALSMLNLAGVFGTLTIDQIMSAVGLDKPASEQIILNVPRMKRIDIAVDVGNSIAQMTWTAGNGATTSSLWNTYSRKEWTTPTYLYLRGWMCDGSYPVRISLQTENAGDAIYTQFGDKVVKPTLSVTRHGLEVRAARGSNVEIFQSRNLRDWTRIAALQSVMANSSSVPVLSVPLTEGALFFQGESN